MNRFLDQCRTLIGDQHVLTDQTALLPFLTDYRRRFVGRAIAVLKPASTAEVAGIVQLCNQAHIGITPQGGNTGLVLGSVPDLSGHSVVLSLTRMNRIIGLDPLNDTMTVQAGCVLEQVQQAADQANRLFPLSLASEGSCTIGGNLSTNAGGTAVLHYGNARTLCLGLEVVTANGQIWDGLRGLRKDNTGYDLRDLFIGAEGTLGIITGAVLKLFPRPACRVTAMAALDNVDQALALLAFLRQHSADTVLSAFELMSSVCMELVGRHFPHIRQPALGAHPYQVLIEFSSQRPPGVIEPVLEDLLQAALAQQLVNDAVLASSLEHSKELWAVREAISDAQAAEGKNIKHDIAIPVSSIPRFIEVTDALLQHAFPGCRMVNFGHLGDGNLHYNVSAPLGISADTFLEQQEPINRIVYDSVTQFAGSISAEHGLGALKRDEILRYKSPTEMQLMRAIKFALDPNNIMNPGKIFQPTY